MPFVELHDRKERKTEFYVKIFLQKMLDFFHRMVYNIRALKNECKKIPQKRTFENTEKVFEKNFKKSIDKWGRMWYNNKVAWKEARR